MPFMTGNVVSEQLCKIVCNFELVFVFFTPTTDETGTGYRTVSGFDCYGSHSRVWDASYYFLQMSAKLIKCHFLFLRQYMLYTELTY